MFTKLPNILGIIKEGGVRVNIIPEKAVLQLAVRAPLDKDVALLKEKVVACFHAAATATGCQVTLCLSRLKLGAVLSAILFTTMHKT